MNTQRIWKGMAVLALVLSGCGSSQQAAPVETSASAAAAETAAASPTAAAATAVSESREGGVLVAYFSATGHTQEIAEWIAEETDGDVFVITPQEPYTEDDLDYNDPNSRVSQEHENPDLQEVALAVTEVPDWDRYDTVFLGYPIWWGGASWVVSSFTAVQDFTGKTVIPFCTSSASGIGTSGSDLAELAGTGTWLEGQRFSHSATQEDVQAWVQEVLSE